jgi:signal transduction histidine kinase/CheY-like chemotaxis protein
MHNTERPELEMTEQTKGVLIVEDEASIRTLIRDLIQPDGYEIYEAAHASEGIYLLSKNNIHLVITDIILPDISGVDFVKSIRKISAILPVIAITGHTARDDIYELVAAGIYAYLKKPFVDRNVVRTAVRSALTPGRFAMTVPDEKFIKRYPRDPGDFVNEIIIAKQEWESAVDFLGRVVMLVDPDRNICRCNNALCALTGMTYQDLLGKKWDDILRETGFVPLPGDFHLSGGVEFYNDASKHWMLVHIFPSYEIDRETESVPRQVITFHEITELKRATEEIRHQREKIRVQNTELQSNQKTLEGALDQLSNLIVKVETTQSFNIRFENPNLVTCNETLNCRNLECPCYGVKNARCWQTAGTHCCSKIQGDFVKEFGQCEKCPVFVEATSNPIFRIGEHFNNMMNMLEQKNKEVEEAYEKLKLTQAQILHQEKMASIGQLAAGIAHEINNPVGFIMSNLNSLHKYINKMTEFIEVLADVRTGNSDPAVSLRASDRVGEYRKAHKIDYIVEDARNLIKESFDGAERVKKIVQDLKSFSRVDEAEFKMADINAGIESTINIVWNELKYKAALHKEYGDIPQTKCNPGHLNQVFMNILVNAAQAIEKKGDISIKTWRSDGHINVSISDTGPGIPADKITRIFEPFFTTKEVGKGTGLGLSIAYDIIQKHNGYIGVDSELGKGTTFMIKIPVVEG